MWLLAFDFDGTLSPSEMTTLLGRQKGVGEEIERITDAAMAGEIEYAESLRNRVAALADLPVAEMEAAFQAVELYPGAADVVANVAASSVTTAILTGGFERGVETTLADADVSVDVVVANRLVLESGRLTGEVRGPHIEGDKGATLRRLADERDIPMDATAAVGDGANDLPMLEIASLAIGYQPKPIVEPVCDITVSTMPDLEAVLQDHGLIE